MEHHLVGETVQVLEKLEREIMAELAKAHNDTLKANLNEIRVVSSINLLVLILKFFDILN